MRFTTCQDEVLELKEKIKLEEARLRTEKVKGAKKADGTRGGPD
jgi:hypothetical protein